VDAFPDEDFHVPALAVMPDGKALIAPDDSALAGERAAVVSLIGTALTPSAVLPFAGPSGIVASPFGQLALGTAFDGKADGYYTFAYTSGAAAPFAKAQKVAVTPKASGPEGAVVFKRGVRKGLVLIPETDGVRTLRLGEDGSIADGGVLLTTDGSGEDFAGIAGPLGFAP
jgi:hypothetical protein